MFLCSSILGKQSCYFNVAPTDISFWKFEICISLAQLRTHLVPLSALGILSKFDSGCLEFKFWSPVSSSELSTMSTNVNKSQRSETRNAHCKKSGQYSWASIELWVVWLVMRGWFYRKKDPFPFHLHVEKESMKYGGKGTNKQKLTSSRLIILLPHDPGSLWSNQK